VSLVVYNMMGQVVRVLVREHQLAGFHQMEWNGRDDDGRSVASGLLYRFASGEVVRTNRMIMLK
jgi:flagellar hook assembly protein FlgD